MKPFLYFGRRAIQLFEASPSVPFSVAVHVPILIRSFGSTALSRKPRACMHIESTPHRWRIVTREYTEERPLSPIIMGMKSHGKKS